MLLEIEGSYGSNDGDRIVPRAEMPFWDGASFGFQTLKHFDAFPCRLFLKINCDEVWQ